MSTSCGCMAVLLSVLTLVCPPAWSQGAGGGYPVRPVTIVVPYDPGGAVGLECLMYTPKLAASLGQQFLLDYKPGGGTVIGTQYVAKSRPDGYTLLSVATAFTVFPAFYKDLPFDVSRDLAPITLMSKQSSVLQVRPSFPAKTLAEYLAYAKANPGRINYGMAGNGTISHLAGAWLHSATGTQVTFIPFKGTGPILQELLAERIDVGSGLLISTLPLIKSGKVRPLAMLGDQRSPQLPDLPTVAEQGVPGYNYSGWIGFLAPGGTPDAIINRLSEAFAKAVKAPDVVAELDKQGSIGVGSTPAQFRQVIQAELARWKKVVEDAGIKVD